MPMVQIQLPEEPLISLKETPATFANEIKVLAAVKLFELGRLSSGRAAQLAGMSRVAFLMNLGRYQVSPFSADENDVINA
jgi:predicted HTH domain antitoxin